MLKMLFFQVTLTERPCMNQLQNKGKEKVEVSKQQLNKIKSKPAL